MTQCLGTPVDQQSQEKVVTMPTKQGTEFLLIFKEHQKIEMRNAIYCVCLISCGVVNSYCIIHWWVNL